MKKLLILIFTLSVTYSMQAQEVSDKQWSLITKRTADWCPHCGTWGWDFFQSVLAETQNEDVIVWAVHHGGGLSNDVSKEVLSSFKASGQPKFFLNTEPLEVTSNNTADKLAEILDFVPAINDFEPSEIVGAEIIVKEDVVEVKKKIQFKLDRTISDNMFVASYIVKNELISSQAGRGNEARHKNVLLGSVSGKGFGDAVPNGSYSEGDEHVFNYTINRDLWSYGTEDISIVTIVWTWDPEDDAYSFINANKQSLTTGPSSTKNLINNTDCQVINVDNDNLTIHWNGTTLDAAHIIMTDMQGRLITQVNQDLETDQIVNISYPAVSSGIYLINIRKESNQTTKQVMIP